MTVVTKSILLLTVVESGLSTVGLQYTFAQAMDKYWKAGLVHDLKASTQTAPFPSDVWSTVMASAMDVFFQVGKMGTHVISFYPSPVVS